MIEETLLALSNYAKPFEVQTYASGYATEECLSNMGNCMRFKVVIQEKEMIAIVHCFPI